MSMWNTLCLWEAQAKYKAFKQGKSDNIKQHEQLNNRKAFINKKHNLTSSKKYLIKGK